MATASPSPATVATIETKSLSQGQAEKTVRIALLSAVEVALTGAIAMDLP